jgi:hypothetical protein
MAYMDQERKAAFAPKIKAICKKYGMKGTLSVRNYSMIVLNIPSGALDIIGNTNAKALKNADAFGRTETMASGYLNVNNYCLSERYTGRVLSFLTEIFAVLYEGNHNNSDLMTDYHDVGWYVDVKVGHWDKPYICTTVTERSLAALPFVMKAEEEALKAEETPLNIVEFKAPAPATTPAPEPIEEIPVYYAWV